MSRRLGGLDAEVAAGVIAAAVDLPPTVELVSLRTLGWPMGELVNGGVRLNLLSLEAVAAAIYLEAEICLDVADDNGPLVDVAHRLGIPLRRLS